MTNEEIQRTMEFILGQQAQFAANIQQLQEERRRDNPRLVRLEESFQLLVQLAQTTDSRLDSLESRTTTLQSNLATLESINVSIGTNMVALEIQIAALAASQAQTDEKLRALIDIVRNGRNGSSN